MKRRSDTTARMRVDRDQAMCVAAWAQRALDETRRDGVATPESIVTLEGLRDTARRTVDRIDFADRSVAS